MIYTVNNNLVDKINFLREKLENLVEKNDGELSLETIKISRKLDRLLVIYYEQEYIQTGTY